MAVKIIKAGTRKVSDPKKKVFKGKTGQVLRCVKCGRARIHGTALCQKCIDAAKA